MLNYVRITILVRHRKTEYIGYISPAPPDISPTPPPRHCRTSTMISILYMINNKPSKALWFALEGVKQQQRRPEFEINLRTYGKYEASSGRCWGCISTCAIQEAVGQDLEGVDFTNSYYRSEALGLDRKELELFEYAVDYARCGDLGRLLRFCGVPYMEALTLTVGFMEKLDPEYRSKYIDTLAESTSILQLAYKYLTAIGL